MIIILFGVSSCGKTVVGKALAKALGWKFVDGDDHHPKENVEKMRRGIPLEDQDRFPWLERLAAIERESIKKQKDIVLACSALKKDRMHKRSEHFINPALIESQFDALEEPEGGIVVNGDADVAEIVKEIRSKICL